MAYLPPQRSSGSGSSKLASRCASATQRTLCLSTPPYPTCSPVGFALYQCEFCRAKQGLFRSAARSRKCLQEQLLDVGATPLRSDSARGTLHRSACLASGSPSFLYEAWTFFKAFLDTVTKSKSLNSTALKELKKLASDGVRPALSSLAKQLTSLPNKVVKPKGKGPFADRPEVRLSSLILSEKRSSAVFPVADYLDSVLRCRACRMEGCMRRYGDCHQTETVEKTICIT